MGAERGERALTGMPETRSTRGGRAEQHGAALAGGEQNLICAKPSVFRQEPNPLTELHHHSAPLALSSLLALAAAVPHRELGTRTSTQRRSVHPGGAQRAQLWLQKASERDGGLWKTKLAPAGELDSSRSQCCCSNFGGNWWHVGQGLQRAAALRLEVRSCCVLSSLSSPRSSDLLRHH